MATRKRVALRFATALVFLTLVGVDRIQAAPSDTPLSHTRPMDAAARMLVANAQAASPTVARLVATLESSDIIVMVTVTFMRDGLAADTRLLSTTATARLLSIRIDQLRPPREQMAWLGHELQHAVEIAGAPEVRSDAGLVALLKRVGRSREQGRMFETVAATDVGRQVEREIADSRR